MSLHLTSNDSYQPPEYRSDNQEACVTCLVFVDVDDESYLRLDNDEIQCEDCRKLCTCCGEWLTCDPKQVVWLRCTTTGRLEPHHAECAAEELE